LSYLSVMSQNDMTQVKLKISQTFAGRYQTKELIGQGVSVWCIAASNVFLTKYGLAPS